MTQKLYFPALDGLRFFAFLLVFMHHLPPSTAPVLGLLHEQGWVGVHVFLFLSAYLLTAILKSEQNATCTISIRNFYLRRALRIWPLYFVFCLTVFVWSNFWHSQLSIEWFRFAGLAGFFDNIVAGFYGYNPIPYTAHLWTISLEEQFYLILPLLLVGLIAYSARLLRGLFVCWIIFVAARLAAVLLEAPHPMIWTSVFSADSLLLGTALGAIRPIPAKTLLVRLTIVSVGIISVFSGVFFPPIENIGIHQVLVYSLVAIGAAALTMAALYEPLLGFLKAPLLCYLGKISYGLYVFHLFGIAIANKITLSIGSTLWSIHALASLTITVLLATLSYELFERHFLRFKKNFEAVHSRPI